jgi:hypothetical protein
MRHMFSMTKRSLLVISTIAIATSLTSCGGAGNNAPTRLISKVTDGSEYKFNNDGNLVYVRNLLVVTQDNGDATLVGTIVNQKNTNDALLVVSVDGVNMALAEKNYPVLQNKPVIFGGDSSNASAVIKSANLEAGKHVQVKLFLGISGSVTIETLVVNSENPYAK